MNDGKNADKNYSSLYRAYSESDIVNMIAINSGQYESISKELLVTNFQSVNVFNLFKDQTRVY